ncbi:hypothetical protein DNTS_026610, partial [Danionella cerebrum]
ALHFLVEWNEVERKFAVTCQDRTLQRRGDASGSRAGLFSNTRLRGLHAQLSGFHPELVPFFPELTCFSEPSVWELLFSGATQHDERDPQADAVCRWLERYLSRAVDACGRRIVLDALFSSTEEEEEEEEDASEYCENLQELRSRAARDAVTRARDRLGDRCLRYETLGPKRVSELETELNQWRRRGEEATHSIQELTAEYFKESACALTGMLKQMEQDRKRFGSASWALATPRVENLKLLLAKETLQHMRAREMCLKRRRDTVHQQMSGVPEAEGVCVLSELELQYYDTQLQLHDCRLEILRNQELLIHTRMLSMRREIRELQEQVVYYDTCQDPQELQDVEVCLSPAHSELESQLKHLEKQRGEISSRRAYLRNQRVRVGSGVCDASFLLLHERSRVRCVQALCSHARVQHQASPSHRSELQQRHHAAQLVSNPLLPRQPHHPTAAAH